ncbi:hypothetical protein CTAYLR_000604 [Chrysophaeum taylorii]|uniref:Divinyl chlorophyllide a 8-vinyl-reductase, chloroplastic n=1 Tax=Chrysophaeum taylorii TaxID=2483200 RepID=A0AAD7UGU0_9STRA|nr:hypothetical protein CTAYLR_000604 [Chrysophaeum taylorii]
MWKILVFFFFPPPPALGLSSVQTRTTKAKPPVCVVGATGYIGRHVVQECVRRGYPTTAVVRKETESSFFQGAEIVVADPTKPLTLDYEAVICCLASRSGSKADSLLVDYEASTNCLRAAEARGAHFVLLSAFCVAKPQLQFQFAKLKTEQAIRDSTATWSIVRPTAFFKSVSGQVEIVRDGGPFVYFDLGGRSATCNPIAESDLAKALVDCVSDPSRKNQIWNVGGPGDGISMRDQGKLIAEAIAEVEGTPRKDPWLLGVPILVFDVILGALDALAKLYPSKFEDVAEFGRIGRYYAVEDMLTTDDAERYGTITLKDHYKNVAQYGQEYDPYTTLFGAKPKKPSSSSSSSS